MGGSVHHDDSRQLLAMDEQELIENLHFVFGYQLVSDASKLTIVKHLLYSHLVFKPLHVFLKLGHIPHLPISNLPSSEFVTSYFNSFLYLMCVLEDLAIWPSGPMPGNNPLAGSLLGPTVQPLPPTVHLNLHL